MQLLAIKAACVACPYFAMIAADCGLSGLLDVLGFNGELAVGVCVGRARHICVWQAGSRPDFLENHGL